MGIYVSALIAVVVAFFLAALSSKAAVKVDSVGLAEKVKQFSNAIAFAEGYWDADGHILEENVPARFHNPGDLGPGDAPGYSSVFSGGSDVVMFPDDSTGWSFLHKKVSRMLSGDSAVFTLDMTITQVAKKYAGDWYNWANNVASYLGVSPSVTLRDWVNS